MYIYTIEKNAMKAVKAILSVTKNATGSREWTKYAYLYKKGLILTDGRRLLRFHDKELESEFQSFLDETGRVVVFSLQGEGLGMEFDVDLNSSYVGTMEKVIVGIDKATSSREITGTFGKMGTKRNQADEEKEMLCSSILMAERFFDPDLFSKMGFRLWKEAYCVRDCMRFSNPEDEDEVLIVKGMAVGKEDL